VVPAFGICIRIVQIELHSRPVIGLVATSWKPVRDENLPLFGVILDRDIDTRGCIEAALERLNANLTVWFRSRGNRECYSNRCFAPGVRLGLSWNRLRYLVSGSIKLRGPAQGEGFLEEPAEECRIALVGSHVPKVSEDGGRQAADRNLMWVTGHRGLLIVDPGSRHP
jgi:hypothetical protein